MSYLTSGHVIFSTHLEVLKKYQLLSSVVFMIIRYSILVLYYLLVRPICGEPTLYVSWNTVGTKRPPVYNKLYKTFKDQLNTIEHVKTTS